MTERLELGSIDLMPSAPPYEWEEHDEQPNYSFSFDPNTGCCIATGAVLLNDSLVYVVKPMTFTIWPGDSNTAAENRDALIAVLDAATAWSLRQTCSPSYTGAPVLLVRQAGDQDDPDVWTVRRYQRKRTRLDLDHTRITLEVDLYCTEGGPVLDPETGLTLIGGNGNPVQGGVF